MKNSYESLSKRQIEITEYIRKGLTDKEIANLLGISVYTVKSHLKRLYKKMEVSGRTELAGLEWENSQDTIIHKWELIVEIRIS